MARNERKRLLRRVQRDRMQESFHQLGADRATISHNNDRDVAKAWEPHEPHTITDTQIEVTDRIESFLHVRISQHHEGKYAECSRCHVKYLLKDLERINLRLVCWKCE